MSKTMTMGLTLALGLGFSPLAAQAQAQVRERDVTITGPRGRSVERKFESVRTPGGLTREMTIQRPGGIYERDVHIARPQPFGGVPFGGGGPRGWGYPPPRSNVFIERDVVVAPPPILPGFSVGPSFNLSLGLPLIPPPRQVIVEPAPVIIQQQPAMVYSPPVTYIQGQQAPPVTVVVDPVAEAIGRLSSIHMNSRRDGAYILGRLGDSRAVAPLIDRLKHDSSKDVRIAAATAIGQIGEPSTAIILERAVIYDKKQEVRDAASLALAKMPKVVQTRAPVTTSRAATSIRSDGLAPLGEPTENVPPPPVPAEPR